MNATVAAKTMSRPFARVSGNSIVYYQADDALEAFRIFSLDSKAVNVFKLPEPWRIQERSLAVSPNGNRIAFVAEDTTEPRPPQGLTPNSLFVMSRDDGRIIKVGQPHQYFSWPDFLDDSRLVYWGDADRIFPSSNKDPSAGVNHYGVLFAYDLESQTEAPALTAALSGASASEALRCGQSRLQPVVFLSYRTPYLLRSGATNPSIQFPRHLLENNIAQMRCEDHALVPRPLPANLRIPNDTLHVDLSSNSAETLEQQLADAMVTSSPLGHPSTRSVLVGATFDDAPIWHLPQYKQIAVGDIALRLVSSEARSQLQKVLSYALVEIAADKQGRKLVVVGSEYDGTNVLKGPDAFLILDIQERTVTPIPLSVETPAATLNFP